MTLEVNPVFSKWAMGFSGCDGGDMGNKSNKGIWICGIEWGGGDEANMVSLSKMFEENVDSPELGYTHWDNNLAFIFNWQIMKLLAAVYGNSVSDYKKFAEEVKPFTIGSTGFFKMNLYPLAFKNTDHAHWKNEFSESTGFKDKDAYLAWIRSNRFPAIRAWSAEFSPKLVICTGKNYLVDFHTAFGDENMKITTESIDERELSYGINNQGTLVAVIPFMVNRHGLTRNVTIQKFGERIRDLLQLTEKNHDPIISY